MSEFLGIENSALKFIIAFVLVMALIGLTAWLIRQFSSARPNSASGGRARQPRLAVLDSAVVDARRRLVLIRRDNVEHLLMIGGPTDVVVEANVVRAQPMGAPAPVAPPRMAHQRAPIEPIEPDYDPSLVPMDEPYYEEPPLPPAPPRPAPQRPAPVVRAPAPPPPQPQPHVHVQIPQPAHAPQPAPRMAPAPQRPTPAAAPRAPQPQPQFSDMAQRLEAALRAPAPEVPLRPAPERPAPPLRAEPQLSAAPAAAPAAPEKESKSSDVFSSLEEEMANLLKPSGGKDSA